MKKIIAVLLSLATMLSLCACTASKEKAAKEEAKAVYEELAALNSACDSLSDFISDIWNIVGRVYVMDALLYMYSMDDDFDAYWDHDYNDRTSIYENPKNITIECKIGDAYGWLNNNSFGISYSEDAKEFHALCLSFQALYDEVSSSNSAVEEKMKGLREEATIDIDALTELYVEVSAYADFCLNPSGSLASYAASQDEYQTEITKLLKLADIY